MPYSIRTKDGIKVNNIPDNVKPDSDEVRAKVAAIRAQRGGKPASLKVAPTHSEEMLGAIENTGIMARNAIAAPIAGIAGIVGGVLPGEQGQSERFRANTQQFIGGSPSTEAGQQQMQKVGEVLAPVGKGIESAKQFLGQGAQDIARDITGSDTAADIAGTVAASAPEAILELLGLKGASKAVKAGQQVPMIPKGTLLLDDLGAPTRALDKALDRAGLTFDNLTPQSKALIPVRSGVSSTQSKVSKVVKEQIKSGARDDALAPLMIRGNKVVEDALAIEASRQGFSDGLIQMAKTATPKTQQGMRKVLNMVKNIKKNSSLASKMRPSDVAGTSLFDRVKFIRNKADSARLQLDKVAKTQLAGAPFDPTPVQQTIRDIFDRLDIQNKNVDPVTGVPDWRGIPDPDFTGSLISGDPTSKRGIKEMIRLLAESKEPTALGAHKMKRQLDNLINFKKKSTGGLGDDGRKALMDIRTSLNQSLRGFSDDYANVNDVLSRSLTAIDDLERAVGPSIQVFGEGGNSSLGTSIRGIYSNRVKRGELKNAFQQVDDVAKELGGEFDDSFTDLSLFTRQIEDVFGPTGADTSFKGEIGSAIKQTITQGPKATLVDKAAGKIGDSVDKARGINEFGAMRSLDELLKRGQ